MIARTLLSFFSAVFVFTLLASQPVARADDIDIYLNPVPITGAEPLVMFSLDLRANTGSSACTTAGGAGDPCNFLRVNSSYTYSDGTTSNFDPYLPAAGTVSTFTLYKAVLSYVLDRTEGIKVGLMLSHANENNCEGPRPANPTNQQKCSNGGYIASGYEPVRNRPNFTAKMAGVTEPTIGAQAHSFQGREKFFEYFRFLTGQGVYNGHNGWTDKGSSNALNMNDALDPAYGMRWDATQENGVADPNALYISPLVNVQECVKLYTVNAMFQVSQQDTDSDVAIRATKGNGGIGINTTNVLPYSNYTDPMARMVRWLFDTDLADGTFGTAPNLNGKQNVTSYFITANNNTTTRQYACAGIGLDSGCSQAPYVMSGDPVDLVNQLKAVFSNILSVSTTFVAPTVAVNVYNRAQVRDDVYIAMFQAPDPYSPAWPGNLKKYRLAKNDSGIREIRDFFNTFAVDPVKGRIKPDALSFWTYAGDLPKAASTETEFVTTKDGRGVARGGAGSKTPGHKLKCNPDNLTDPSCYPGDYGPGLTNPNSATTNVSARKVYYDATTNSLAALNADDTTAAALHTDFAGNVVGTCTAADATANPNSTCNLIIYARGGEYIDHDGNNGTPPVLRGRKWMLGDLLHSRPIAVNYGARGSYTEDNPDVRLIAGSNDGLLRMVRNTKFDQSTPDPNNTDGVEAWAFMPRAAMPNVKKLKANLNPTVPPHPYGVDGSPAVLIQDVNGNGNIESGDKVWLFFGLRRGGNKYYGMDISDPDNPVLMWTITGGSGDFAELGQTWSTPQTGYMLFDVGASTEGTPKPVLIFGGGYSGNKDTHPGHNDADGNPITSTQIGSDDTIGNAVFIVNAETGALVWKAVKGNAITETSNKVFTHTELKNSIPSDITAVDTDGNGLIDRIYVGDTGGRLWRGDLQCRNQDGAGCDSECTDPNTGDPCATAGWKLSPILSVGRHFSNALADDRRFFYAPDFAQSKDDHDQTPNFDAIIIGTGDRENPKDTAVKNWFYMYKDRYTRTGSIPDNFTMVLHDDPQLGDVSNDCLQTETCGGSPPDLTKGWKMRLHCQQSTIDNTCGEKNLAQAVTLGGSVFFTTYIPQTSGISACALPEGNGLFYAVSLQEGFAVEDFFAGNGSALDRRDRASALASGGIPAEVVSLGGGELLKPDLSVDKVDVDSGYRTFWYEKYLK